MTTLQQWIVGAYGAIVLMWPIRHIALTVIFRKFDYLTSRSPRFASPEPPLVTALIPAKDEEETLAGCIESVRAQTYPNLEILVVDDRSTDGTADIARAAAAVDPRVRLVSIDDLPTGWTGKCHALHVATEQANGRWLWYLDADTRHVPDALAIVMEYARIHGASLASLLPEMRCETFWEKIEQPLSGIILMRSFPLFDVNSRRRKTAFANGQFILIERTAYDRAGGHEAVRDRFVEDIYLARRVKDQGDTIRVAIATEISSTRMYTSLPQIVRGWARILYDADGRSVWPLVGKILEPLVFSQTFVLAFALAAVAWLRGDSGPFAAWMAGLAVVHLILQYTVLYRMYRMTSPATARAAAWYPLAGVVSDWILLKAIGMCLTGRVVWRGTVYGAAPAEPTGSTPVLAPSPAEGVPSA